jgi:RNA polymerase sigma-70 factor (ECF subfamily)
MKAHESQATLEEASSAPASPTAELDFETILRETQPRLRAYIAGMGIASHEVDDVAQDVYLELYRGLDRVPVGVAPERWLKGIARNLCLNHIRRNARRGRMHREAITEILAQTQWKGDEPGMHDLVQQALERCYTKLPDQSRRMLVMRYESDLPSADIATAFESTTEAIRVALYRIRAKLKDCISRRLAREIKL